MCGHVFSGQDETVAQEPQRLEDPGWNVHLPEPIQQLEIRLSIATGFRLGVGFGLGLLLVGLLVAILMTFLAAGLISSLLGAVRQ